MDATREEGVPAIGEVVPDIIDKKLGITRLMIGPSTEDQDGEAEQPPDDPCAVIKTCSIGPVGSQVSVGLIVACCGFVVMQTGLMRVYWMDTQHALVSFIVIGVWWAVVWPYTQWKMFRLAFPVCKGLTPLRRKFIWACQESG